MPASDLGVTIAICTRNNAASLRETLPSLAALHVPTDLSAELLFVDNGSTDDTAAVIRSFAHPRLDVRLVHEPRKGLSNARNRVLREGRGEIFLFTDDDVRVPEKWVPRMCTPIQSGSADAVAGGVQIAPHLRRDWMTPTHMSLLASTAALDPEHPSRLVGANFAFARRVLEKVPMFDPELGAGALGFEEETLFTEQLRRAGFQISSAFDVTVEHHFDPSRLTRASFADATRRLGMSNAYIEHHWRHGDRSLLRLYAAMAKCRLSLAARRFWNGGDDQREEGMPEREIHLSRWYHHHRWLLKERKRPRNYERFGFVKRSGNRPEESPSTTYSPSKPTSHVSGAE